MRQYFAFIQKRGRGDVRHHVTRRQTGLARQKRRQAFVDVRVDQAIDPAFAYAGEIGQRDGRVVECIGERRAMKVAAGEYVTARCEDEWIVGGGARFDLHNRRDVVKRVANRTVHLWHTAQAVRVLNSRIVRAMRLPNLAAVEQCRQMPGRDCLSAMGPCLLDARIESGRCATQRLQRHRAGNVGDPDETLCIVKRQRSHGSHGLRAIQQRETFFRFEPQRGQFGPPQCLTAAHARSLVEGFSFTNEDQREMGQWGKIATRPH